MKPRVAAPLCSLLLTLVAVFATTGAAAAPVPPGPRLTLLRFALSAGLEEIVTTSGEPLAEGSMHPFTTVFSAAPKPDALLPGSSAPAWFPDGKRIAFAGTSLADLGQPLALFSVAATGGTPRRIPGTTGGFQPVYSPNGQTLAFAKMRVRTAPNGRGGKKTVYESSTTWTMNLGTGATHRLTDWRNHLAIVPSSFSPDGSTLAATKTTGSSLKSTPKAIALPVQGGPATVILADALAPVYSPDGTRIAFARGRVRHRKSKGGLTTARLTDLYTAAADGSDVRRLTSTPSAAELTPAWDPSGQRLAFVKVHPFEGEELLFSDEIAEINADGSCPKTLISDPKALFFVGTWQPGPGREAGPLTC